MSINLKYEKKYEDIIRKKLLDLSSKQRCRIILFGSRAQNKIKKGSDFDIGIQGLSNKDFDKIAFEFEEFLEESIVPYDVDLINFNTASPEFKKTALKDIKIWKTD